VRVCRLANTTPQCKHPTPGGETSSVIGTILGAHEQWTAASDASSAAADASAAATAVDGDSTRHLFFVYNNPDAVLLPFVRSRTVIEVR
jgi:N-acetylmuramic acid 6-phosphate etherase